jgi:hypothetical protein
MGVTTTKTNKPLNPRGNDQSPLAYNRAKLYSGKALDFDGVNDYVDCGTLDVTAYTACSVAFSFKVNALSGSQIIYSLIHSSSDDIRILITSGGAVQITFDDGTADDIGILNPIELGKIYNVSVSYDGTNVACYINGVEVSTGTASFDFSTADGDLYLGSRLGSGFFFDGEIYGFKQFNTALTAEQVADLYNNPEKVVPTGVDNTALKLWLPMMEGAGTTAYDGSGNGNHGTISGATYVNGIGAPVAQSAVIDWNKASNYIDKSEEFESSYWSENALLTITDDSFIAPDGSATATEIIENTLNTNHFLAQTLSVTAGDYFISVYAKKRDYDFIQLSTGGDTSRYANFNISTGATGNANGITDLIIEDAGNGWYRIGGKITTSSTSFNYFVTLIQSDVASRFQTYTGTDKGQYIWGAQATKSATLQPYLRNIGTSAITSEVLLPQGLTTGRDITGVNLFENVRKQGALNLDGNSWAEVHDNASLDVSVGMTMECWVYINDITTGGRLISKWGAAQPNRSYQMFMNNALVRSLIGDGTTQAATQTTTSLSVGNWYHIAVTYNQTNLKTYLNGVEDDSQNVTFTIYDSNEPVYLGRYVNSSFESVNPIAQPRIYNRALTAEEVQRNYNAGKNTYTN